MSGSLRHHGPQSARLLCPGDSPGTHTGVGCPALLQGILPTQEVKLPLSSVLHGQEGSLPPVRTGKPKIPTLLYWRRPWCWEALGAGGEGDDRGWDGWLASSTWRTWVWVNSGSWWWTGRPGMLQFMGSQRVGHDWAIELNWTNISNI